MLYIEDNAVYITRHDAAALEIAIAIDGDEYTLGEDETLTLTVREKPSTAYDVLLQITTAAGSNRFVVSADDTDGIEPGQYSMDVQLNRADGSVYTILPDDIAAGSRHRVYNWRNFVVMPEVTV